MDVKGPLNAEIQATWFSKSQLLFVDLAVPLEANVEESVSQDEDAIYERLMQDTAPPRKVTPDVVIEVEGTQEAKERGHVVIAIENADPDLQVQIVVRSKRAVLLLV